jgi:hypothetical protein
VHPGGDGLSGSFEDRRRKTRRPKSTGFPEVGEHCPRGSPSESVTALRRTANVTADGTTSHRLDLDFGERCSPRPGALWVRHIRPGLGSANSWPSRSSVRGVGCDEWLHRSGPPMPLAGVQRHTLRCLPVPRCRETVGHPVTWPARCQTRCCHRPSVCRGSR